MKKTLASLLLALPVLAQQAPVQQGQQMPIQQGAVQQGQAGDVKLRTVIPEEDLKLLEERKKQELYETQMRTESAKNQIEMYKGQTRLIKKRLSRTERVEDIRDKELKEAFRMYRYEVPVQGIVGNMAITNRIVLVEGAYVGTDRVSKISLSGVMVGGKPMQVYDVQVNELREKALQAGAVDVFTNINLPTEMPPLPPPPLPRTGQTFSPPPVGR